MIFPWFSMTLASFFPDRRATTLSNTYMILAFFSKGPYRSRDNRPEMARAKNAPGSNHEKALFYIGEPFKAIELWAKIPPRMRYRLPWFSTSGKCFFHFQGFPWFSRLFGNPVSRIWWHTVITMEYYSGQRKRINVIANWVPDRGVLTFTPCRTIL